MMLLKIDNNLQLIINDRVKIVKNSQGHLYFEYEFERKTMLHPNLKECFNKILEKKSFVIYCILNFNFKVILLNLRRLPFSIEQSNVKFFTLNFYFLKILLYTNYHKKAIDFSDFEFT